MPYPNFAGKHAHDALLEPSTFVRYWTAQGLLPESYTAPTGVVVLYQQRLFDAVIQAGDVSPFAPRGERHTAFLDLHTFDRTGGTVGVIGGFGIGAPAATSVVESLAAIGVRQFVSMGTAGALRNADEGVSVVEMEAAALFSVGHHRGLEVASAFAISDSLADGEWTPQFGDRRLAAALMRMVPAAVTALAAEQR